MREEGSVQTERTAQGIDAASSNDPRAGAIQTRSQAWRILPESHATQAHVTNNEAWEANEARVADIFNRDEPSHGGYEPHQQHLTDHSHSNGNVSAGSSGHTNSVLEFEMDPYVPVQVPQPNHGSHVQVSSLLQRLRWAARTSPATFAALRLFTLLHWDL